jgi:maltose/moltooligosaccharide transporter
MSDILDKENEGAGVTLPDPPEQEPHELSGAQTFWYSLANLGYGMFFSFNNAVMTLFLQRFTTSQFIIGMLGSTHSIEGAVIQPIVGTYSDRLRHPLGRRRPFMLRFIPISALFMVLSPVAAHLPASIRLTMVFLCIFVFTFTFNIAFDPYQSLMPDITPVRQRGRVMGIWTLLGVLGQASILLIPIDISLKFYLVAAVMLITTLLTCWKVREPRAETLPVVKVSHKDEWQNALRGLGTLREAAKGLMVFFLSGIGIGAVLPYLTTFVKTITHCSDYKAQLMFMVLMLSTAFTVIPCGWLVDRFGSKTMLVVSLVLIAIASLNALWITTLAQVTMVLIVAGVGNAAQSAAAYPLMTELIPSEEVGWYTGLQTMALSIATPLTIYITSGLIERGSYRAIFAVCAISMVLALFVLLTVSKVKASREIVQRNLEQGRTV